MKHRVYGSGPYRVCVIHGGPGAVGQVRPVAERLSVVRGVVEPLLVGCSIQAQVEEIREALGGGSPPFVLVGSSWGAMLGLIFCARHPELVRMLIMVGSGVLDERYSAEITRTRLRRLSAGDRERCAELLEELDGCGEGESERRDELMGMFGRVIQTADAYDPIAGDTEEIRCDYEVFSSVWPEADDFRRNGGFYGLKGKISCPVLAIHGDYDPHPAEGVRGPLLKLVKDFRFVLLERCGHLPWLEKQAREGFYDLLQREIDLALESADV